MSPTTPEKIKNDADKPAEIHGLFKEQDTQDSGADNPYSGPDCIGGPYWQSFQGLERKSKLMIMQTTVKMLG